MFLDELAGWEALCYTQRGVSPSSSAGPFTVATHVADALAVLDHHGVDAAVLVGHSWGAFLACCITAQAPERVRRLVLVDGLGSVGDGGEAEFTAALLAATPPAALARAAELDERAMRGEGSEEEGVESLRLFWPAYFADPAAAPPMPAGLRMSVACYAGTLESLREVLAEGRTAAALAAFTGPVEIVYGASSPMPASAATSTAALFADAVVTSVPSAGHFLWIEQPEAITHAMQRLATRLQSTAQ